MSSMSTVSPEGYILTPSGWAFGRLVIEADRIFQIDAEPVRLTDRPNTPYILPGFIDLHVHGAEESIIRAARKNVRKFIRYHARSGTVALTPTTSTSPIGVIESSLADIERIRKAPRADEPAVLGAHLEGPFINAGKLRRATKFDAEGRTGIGDAVDGHLPLRVATVAPEIEGGISVVEAFSSRGCRVQIGHSLATAEETAHGFARGLSGFTHLFNGMTGAHHRDAGVAAYALGFGRYAELICDLNHVSPTMVMAAYRAIPRLYAITDATTAAGLPDGTYNFRGDHPIIKNGLTIMLADGSSLAEALSPCLMRSATSSLSASRSLKHPIFAQRAKLNI